MLLSGDVGRTLAALTGTRRPRSSAGLAPATASPQNPFADDLVVVGTGIRTVGHLTLEALASIRGAEKVVYLVSDPVAEAVIRKFHGRSAESLQRFYAEDRVRKETYDLMVEAVLRPVRQGRRTCFAAYGHPGVFAYPTHEAIRRARAEGYRARMLPGISAEDCLFADLGIDPATTGCQTYEATDFLLYQRPMSPTSYLVLWQIGALGHVTYKGGGYDPRGMPHLLNRLLAQYPPQHPVIVYEAAVFAGHAATIRPLPLALLPQTPLSTASTLCVPPASTALADAHVLQAMGLAR